ncbi:uncharacterized protein LAJ45_11063 [Morchella importuna]|nr:uncharacterized protein LAJ45_11063 [Morchella importuna]KAH8144942.1 hypothetical protein LAJ45_11063 [Morchella importuna]
MTTSILPSILPSIKISKSGVPVSPSPSAPRTIVNDIGSENGRPTTSGNDVPTTTGGSTAFSNGSQSKFSNSTLALDTERLQSPTTSTARRKGVPMREGTALVDPLTMQILRRTGTENTIRQKARKDSNDDAQNEGVMGAIPERNPSDTIRHMDAQPQKKKGVSFLSRIMGGKKKGGDAPQNEDGFEVDMRTEGMDAHVFSEPIGGHGFTPQFPAPPKYIRVRSQNKHKREFDQTFLAQELYRKHEEHPKSPNASKFNLSTASLSSIPAHKSGAIWAMRWSKDGRYIAAGGQDKIVRVWQVISTKEERGMHEKEEEAAGTGSGGVYSGGRGVRLNAPVFRSEPIHEYTGHTADVLDLSWSKNNFLLSSSMDKTVRLWHVSRNECLCCFQHSDFVTAICFHPRDDRFFLAGSLDSKLRLWSIPDKSVAFWNELPDLITAVAFTPDGRMAIAGCLSGLCLFYETEGLRYHTQVHVRSSHGKNAKGSKITGIETITFPPNDPNGEVKILITSNDSRVRMYNARDKSLEVKFKGNENTCSQIHATFSDDAQYVISGSEDRRVYIWNVGSGEAERKDKRPAEHFEAHPAIVTVAIMAPTATRQLLGGSGDPLYDLCNPPPVTLVSRGSDSISSKKHPESLADHKSEDSSVLNIPKPPEESPAYLQRSTHPDGNIIVTADYTGRIKVFRQDCAFNKRKSDSFDTASTLSKKIGDSLFNGHGRRNSSHSHHGSDRIQSWRQSIASNGSLEGSIRGHRNSLGLDGSSNRSVSPRKSMGAMSIGSGSTSNRFMRSGSVRSRASRATSIGVDGPIHNGHNAYTVASGTNRGHGIPSSADGKVLPDVERPRSTVQNQTGNGLRGQGANQDRNSGMPMTRASAGSSRHRLSAVDSDESDEEVFSSNEGEESENETVRCKRCGGTSFRAKQSKKGEHKLLCVKCNSML